MRSREDEIYQTHKRNKYEGGSSIFWVCGGRIEILGLECVCGCEGRGTGARAAAIERGGGGEK